MTFIPISFAVYQKQLILFYCKKQRNVEEVRSSIFNQSLLFLYFVNSAVLVVASGAPGAVGGSAGPGTPTGLGSSTIRFTTGLFPRIVPSSSTLHSEQNRPRNQAATYGGAAGGGMAGADSSGLGPSSRISLFSKLSSRFSKR